MTALLGAAGRAFLKEFGASLLVLGAGIWMAPNKDQAILIALAAIVGSVGAGLKALTVFVPQLTFEHWAAGKGGVFARYAYVADAAVRAMVSGLIALGVGLADWFVQGDPTLGGAKLFITAGLIAIGSAVVTAIQGAFTKGTSPSPPTGLTTPAATIVIIMVASAILIGVALKPHHWSPQTSPHHWKAPATQMAAKSPHHW